MNEPSADSLFSRHAASYAASPSHAAGQDLQQLLQALQPQPGERAVDVATGTGHTALALAAQGVQVVGVDPNPAMLAQAEQLASRLPASRRPRWLQADVDALPLAPASWELVTCRRAAHHFPDIPRAVARMATLLRAGGRLGIADMCPAEDIAEAVNHLERLRDSTHRQAFTESAWRQAIQRCGLHILSWQVLHETVSWAAWLQPLPADGPQAHSVRRALAALPPAVRQAITGGREGQWVKRRLVVVAVRPEGAP